MSHATTEIETRDGRAPANVFTPDSGQGPWPGVLFFMDGMGVRPALFEMGQRLADAGYCVLLPDLFYRSGRYDPPGPRLFQDAELRMHWITTYMAPLTASNVRSDTEAYLEFLGQYPSVSSPRVGTTGYCLGGRVSLWAAGDFPDRVAAAASYHGANLASEAEDSPHRLADRIKARVYVAGAVEDALFPEEQKQRLIEAFTRAGVDHVVETYEGAHHGWVPRDTGVHHVEGAERHWRTLLDLFGGTLKVKR